jgi:putative endonuclease
LGILFDMVKHNQRIGKWGEDTVAAYLIERGYEIIARNTRTPYGEIDIVAKQQDITIFIEVKTRTSNKMGLPEESVNVRKQAHMLACAEHYAAEYEIDHWQIDVISVEGKVGLVPRITHFENAI